MRSCCSTMCSEYECRRRRRTANADRRAHLAGGIEPAQGKLPGDNARYLHVRQRPVGYDEVRSLSRTRHLSSTPRSVATVQLYHQSQRLPYDSLRKYFPPLAYFRRDRVCQLREPITHAAKPNSSPSILCIVSWWRGPCCVVDTAAATPNACCVVATPADLTHRAHLTPRLQPTRQVLGAFFEGTCCVSASPSRRATLLAH
jgi:hypothetical protein